MSTTAPVVAPITADGYQPVTTFGGILINAMRPWLTLHLAWYLDAIGAIVDPLYNLVVDQGVDGAMPTVGTKDGNGNLITEGFQAGYASALDPQQASAGYGYLAQFVGVALPDGVDIPTAKSLVLSEQGMSRGTTSAMIAAAKRFLSGTQSVYVLERTFNDGRPAAGWDLVVVKPEEVIDLQALIDAVNAVKFGGRMWTLVQADAPVVNQYTRQFNQIVKPLNVVQLPDVT